jgi:hypothetical protein
MTLRSRIKRWLTHATTYERGYVDGWNANPCGLPKEHAERLAAALVWASGSDDFAPGGKAREGWERVAQPALDAYLKEATDD